MRQITSTIAHLPSQSFRPLARSDYCLEKQRRNVPELFLAFGDLDVAYASISMASGIGGMIIGRDLRELKTENRARRRSRAGSTQKVKGCIDPKAASFLVSQTGLLSFYEQSFGGKATRGAR
jgi:hypothetical protein